jgi:uncharacterized FlaG/YvyC family protein
MKSEINAVEPGSGVWLSTGSGLSPWRDCAPDKPARASAAEEETLPAGLSLIQEKIDEVNRRLVGQHRRIEYSLREQPDVCVITLYDTRTGDVIWQIPCEKILTATPILDRFGILVNEER